MDEFAREQLDALRQQITRKIPKPPAEKTGPKAKDTKRAQPNGYTRIFIPRSARPGRTQEWFDKKVAELGGDLARALREYPEEPREAFLADPEHLYFAEVCIQAMEDLGSEWDDQLNAGTLPPSINGAVYVSFDWGKNTSSHVIYPMGGDNYYIADEHIDYARSAEACSIAAVNLAEHYGTLTEGRYDAAGTQPMQSFIDLTYPRVEIVPVKFNSHKYHTANWIKMISERTKAGELIGRIGISARCPVLLEQMREYKQRDDGKFEKGNDHSVDDLIAGLTPEAVAWNS